MGVSGIGDRGSGTRDKGQGTREKGKDVTHRCRDEHWNPARSDEKAALSRDTRRCPRPHTSRLSRLASCHPLKGRWHFRCAGRRLRRRLGKLHVAHDQPVAYRPQMNERGIDLLACAPHPAAIPPGRNDAIPLRRERLHLHDDVGDVEPRALKNCHHPSRRIASASTRNALPTSGSNSLPRRARTTPTAPAGPSSAPRINCRQRQADDARDQ
jgi:hypothetical protein